MATDPDRTPPAGGPLSPEDLITLNEEIAGMARAGLPLDQGLSAMAREMGRGRLREVTGQLGADLRAGLTLPQALQRQGGHVPPFYAALLAAGIRSGRISTVLATLTLYARAIIDFRNTVVSALLYPALVLLLGFGLLVFVAMAILPGMSEIFEGFRLQLPVVTRALVFVGRHPMEILVLPFLVTVVVLVTSWMVLRATRRGRKVLARMVYALPVAGTLIRSARLAAFADLLGILVDESIPLAEGLCLAAEASSDPLLTEGAGKIDKDLRQGMPLGKALSQEGLVPELVVWMIGFGERQGTLGPALHQVAQLYRRKAEVRAALLRTVLPPLLVVGMAATLGTLFVFGLMSPMYSLLEGLSGGKL
jgi:type II secretory pathway component PulF